MWGGWYADPQYMNFMEQAKQLSETLEIGVSAVQVAVLVDENAPSLLDDKDPDLRMVFFDFRETLGKTAVPLHWYLASDFEAIKDRYHAFILLEPVETKLSAAIKISGKSVLTVTPESCHITTEDIRSFLTGQGVNLYSTEDMVIYANRNYLFVHTVSDGKHQLLLPEGAMLKECFSGELFCPSFDAAAGKSFLFNIHT